MSASPKAVTVYVVPVYKDILSISRQVIKEQHMALNYAWFTGFTRWESYILLPG